MTRLRGRNVECTNGPWSDLSLMRLTVRHLWRTLMAETNISFSGSIPQMYDRYLGPVLFEPYAVDLARRVAATHATGSVLEMACGTGIVTQQLRTHLAPGIKIVATDLSQPMLDYA